MLELVIGADTKIRFSQKKAAMVNLSAPECCWMPLFRRSEKLTVRNEQVK
jgi:hypothetical protein